MLTSLKKVLPKNAEFVCSYFGKYWIPVRCRKTDYDDGKKSGPTSSVYLAVQGSKPFGIAFQSFSPFFFPFV